MNLSELLDKIEYAMLGSEDEDGDRTDVRVCLGGDQHEVVGVSVDGRGRLELSVKKVLPAVCVIDDDAGVAKCVEDSLSFCAVTKLLRIPDDTSELEKYDVLIVDNQGIGNENYANGIEFLNDYAPEHLTQTIVCHSGLVLPEHRKDLEEAGVRVVPKGSGDGLVWAVRCALGKTS